MWKTSPNLYVCSCFAGCRKTCNGNPTQVYRGKPTSNRSRRSKAIRWRRWTNSKYQNSQTKITKRGRFEPERHSSRMAVGKPSSLANDERKINNKALTFMFLVVEDTNLGDLGNVRQLVRPGIHWKRYIQSVAFCMLFS